MSDTQLYYEQLRGRARQLVNRLDDALDGVLAIDRAVDEVMRADMDNPGELSTTDGEDLRQFLDTARLSLRAAERIAVAHASDVEGAMRRLGLAGEKAAV
ncbi:hypothetical protein [Amycolatopsis sp. GM8]|uniref:hypothetical protein n=1 Tax=Amycolatopsis sp. GM8 TaxID=2896530 RepID=UPI001F3D721F|nr:hypothetical protein [Amycolatopsis sp. GM8]